MLDAPIGVFDSGIGGLTVVRELIRLMPNENYIYCGDTARAPYGSRPPGQIIDFMHQILRFMADRQVKLAVYACNTMTALGLESARRYYPFPLVGMNTGVRSALAATRNKNIGVIATQATIASGKHGKAAKVLDPHVAVYPQACPKFVPFIERGVLTGPQLEDAALEYLLPLKEAAIDTLILGCTHYPMIDGLLGQILGPDVTLVDPARDTAADARGVLAKSGRLAAGGQGSLTLCFSAGLERARQLTVEVLGETAGQFNLVDLQDYAIA